jgi:hypothetical protein
MMKREMMMIMIMMMRIMMIMMIGIMTIIAKTTSIVIIQHDIPLNRA